MLWDAREYARICEYWLLRGRKDVVPVGRYSRLEYRRRMELPGQLTLFEDDMLKKQRDQLSPLEREAATLDTGEDTIVQQNEKDNADINVIMRRFGATQTIPAELIRDTGVFDDFTGVVDFQEAMEAGARMREAFLLLPAKVRAQLNNDPRELVAVLNDPDQADRAVELGLRKKPEDAGGTSDAPKGGSQGAPVRDVNDSGESSG